MPTSSFHLLHLLWSYSPAQARSAASCALHLRIPFLFDSTRADAHYLYDYHLTRGIGYTRLRYANLGTWELVQYHIAR